MNDVLFSPALAPLASWFGAEEPQQVMAELTNAQSAGQRCQLHASADPSTA